LLLNHPPWGALASNFDLTVMLQTPIVALRERLKRRWVGQDLSETEITNKLDNNDIPNAIFVLEHSSQADFDLEN